MTDEQAQLEFLRRMVREFDKAYGALADMHGIKPSDRHSVDMDHQEWAWLSWALYGPPREDLDV